jgi:DNA-binding MarR family transcriptional regulator
MTPGSLIQQELVQRRPFASPQHEAFLALLRTASVLRRGPTKVAEDHRISLPQYNVLRILRGAGSEGLATLLIRERLVEEAAGITRLLDKLEKAGLVRRDRSSATDRRKVICHITSEGLALLDVVDPPLIRAVDDSLASLDRDELAQLMALLDRARSAAGTQIAGKRARSRKAT